jgi:hypothetical protein
MHGPHYEEEHQAEDQCENFLIGPVINKSEKAGLNRRHMLGKNEIFCQANVRTSFRGA